MDNETEKRLKAYVEKGIGPLCPEAQSCVNEAIKKRDVYVHFVVRLEKRVDALVQRKIANFGETIEGINEAKEEIEKIKSKTAKKYLALYKLQDEVRDYDIPFFGDWQKHIDQIREIEESLRPFEESIANLEAKIEGFNQIPEKKRLLHSIDVAQSMYEDIYWLLVKGSCYDKAFSAQEFFKQDIERQWCEQEKRVKKTTGYEIKTLPRYEGFWKPEDVNAWKEVAEEQFKAMQKRWYEKIETVYLKKQTEDRKNDSL
jgi:hypothetical protein